MFYIVIRPFDGPRRFEAGELVDTRGWTHTHQLRERRFIRPATAQEIEAEQGAKTETLAAPAKTPVKPVKETTA